MFASVASMIDLFNMDNIKILEDLGYTVDVACNFEQGSITSQDKVNEFREELEKKGISAYHIPVPRKIIAIGSMMKAYKKLSELLKENNYDIVHCHSPIGGVIARMACKKYRKSGTKVIYTAHGFHFYTGAPILNWILFYPIERYCAKCTDVIITINLEDYSRAKNFKSKKIEYVPGIGIDVKSIQSSRADKKMIRTKLGINNEDFLLFSAGQLSKRKNHEVIINALSKVKSNNVKFLLCGLGELEDYLKNLSEKLGIEDRVIFAGYRNDVKELLYAADCFVFPSLQEGLPVALMEAMAVGIPVICTDIRGNTDLIKNGKGGYILKTDDVDGFAEKIDEVNRDRLLAQKFCDTNINTIKQFDSNIIKEHMNIIYSSINKENY